MAITRKNLKRASFSRSRPGPVRMVVIHATEGVFPGDHDWLLGGGGKNRAGKDIRVSVHYYIDKRGRVTQMVDDADTAWHAGESSWLVDGHRTTDAGCNPMSVGIELENRNNGRDPYPEAQYDATLELTRDLVKRFNVPRNQLVRHLDISPGRKIDPAAFPWARFVADVYNADGPQPERLTADQQLRGQLIDLAYRAAHAGAPAGWPLLKESISRGTGMPIATLSTPPPDGDNTSEDQPNRPLNLANQPPLVAELYGRDLYYVPLDQLEQSNAIQSWSATPAGELRHLLAVAMFAKADPVQGFHPEWPLHQAFLERIVDTGMPIGPAHRLVLPSDQAYVCQHFAVDSLCAPIDQPDAITRLSDLTRGMYDGDPHSPAEQALRTLLLEDLYHTRTGRAFDPKALFCRFALRHKLGAPIANSESLTIDGRKLVAMPYALDVLFCRVPADGDWDNVAVGVLGEADDDGLALLSSLLTDDLIDDDLANPPETLGPGLSIDEILPDQEYSAGVLGVEIEEPAITELTPVHGMDQEPRGTLVPEAIIVYPTRGTSGNDFAAVAAQDAAPTYHYYVAQDGMITRLLGEAFLARSGQSHNRARGAVAVAVEGASGRAMQADSPQATALRWLLDDIASRHSLGRDQVVQATDLGDPIVDAWEDVLPKQ